ncbi:MAG: sulfotransferase domain-containing protein [Coleofasciculus sp. G1-WW12-02]|uniref:sulfotransferase domain-containing protein n=1 Tax=Coleofasciculus sp. G1-WW12-02 TaxID=3068483 RepID=UPI0032F1DA6A
MCIHLGWDCIDCMRLPNFLVIGAAKAGTTTVYQYLKQHPQIYMSPRKEPHFFSKNGTKDYPIPTLEDYQALFQGASDEIAIGEASTSYLTHPQAAERIQYHIPNAKLIAILRDPANRTYSLYIMLLMLGVRKLSSYTHQEIIDDFHYIVKKRSGLIRGGFYYSHLQRYYSLFPAKQIKLGLFQNLKDNPDELMEDIFNFLGIDSSFTINKSFGSANKGGIPRNKRIDSFIKKIKPIYHTLSPIISQRWSNKIYKTYVDLRNQNLEQPPKLPHEIRQQLIEVYREDILKLQDLLQRDLSIWLQ